MSASRDPATWSAARRWTYAAKPGSWPKLLVPVLLGQAIGISTTGKVDPVAGALGLAFSLFLLLFIVFLNDVGDEAVDRIKREMFPNGCSPKTIPDGILDGSALLVVGVAAGLLAVCVAWLGEVHLGRTALGAAGTGCLLLFVLYTFPPLRLNYRGGGELLEMAGVGVALPWFHAYLQSGDAVPHGLLVLPGFSLLCLASAMASGLSDEESDRKGGKTTFTTRYGNAATRGGVEGVVGAAMVVWALSPRIDPSGLPPWVAFAGVGVVIFNWRRMMASSRHATTNKFGAQKRYKHHLHRAIWHGGLLVSIGLVFARWWAT